MENLHLLGFFNSEAALTSKTAYPSENTVSSCLGNVHKTKCSPTQVWFENFEKSFVSNLT